MGTLGAMLLTQNTPLNDSNISLKNILVYYAFTRIKLTAKRRFVSSSSEYGIGMGGGGSVHLFKN